MAITASIYLDDLLILITRSQDGGQVVKAVCDLYQQLGLKVKESKSVLSPQRYVEHLGFLLDCERHLVILPQAKLAKVTALCTKFLHHVLGNKRRIRKRKLAKMVGFLQSCTYALPFGRFYLQHLYAAFSTSPGWEGIVKVSHPAIKAVQHYWQQLSDQTVQRAWFTPCRSVIVTTDACARGWGAWYHGLSGMHFVQRTWSSAELSLMHNNYLELRAIREAVTSSKFCQVFIRVFSDNMSSVHMVNKLYTPVPSCAVEIKHLLTYLLSHDCAIKAYHVPGPQNSVADYLSRVDVSYQRVSNTVWQFLRDSLVHHLTVDRFASP